VRPAAAWLTLVAVALGLLIGSWSELHHGTRSEAQITDTGAYQSYGDAIARGAVPYRDVRPEYPPAALPVFVLPALGHEGDAVAYDRWFDREMLACACLALLGAALCLAAAGAGLVRAGPALVLVAVAPLLLGSVVLSRYDEWPAALAVLALAALLWRRLVPAALLLGLAVGAKLWPVALAIAHVARTHGARAARWWTAGLVLVLAAIFVPFAAIAPAGLWRVFHLELARPLQLESLGAAVLIAVHHAFGTHLAVVTTYGSQNLVGAGVTPLRYASNAFELLLLIGLWVGYARGPAGSERLLRYSAAAAAVLVAFGEVFSPQYMIWLVPLLPLVAGVRGLLAGSALAAALVLTQSWFPHHYWALALTFAPKQSYELLARDLLVVAIAAVLAWPSLPQATAMGARLRRFARPRPAPRP
jgi:hypothetical protein